MIHFDRILTILISKLLFFFEILMKFDRNFTALFRTDSFKRISGEISFIHFQCTHGLSKFNENCRKNETNCEKSGKNPDLMSISFNIFSYRMKKSIHSAPDMRRRRTRVSPGPSLCGTSAAKPRAAPGKRSRTTRVDFDTGS